jgi:hypothetical protein
MVRSKRGDSKGSEIGRRTKSRLFVDSLGWKRFTLMIWLTGLLPASPVRKGGVKGSYTKMAIFLTGKARPGGRGGFTPYEC